MRRARRAVLCKSNIILETSIHQVVVENKVLENAE